MAGMPLSIIKALLDKGVIKAHKFIHSAHMQTASKSCWHLSLTSSSFCLKDMPNKAWDTADFSGIRVKQMYVYFHKQ